MPETAAAPHGDVEAMTETLRRIEARLEELERWRGRVEGKVPREPAHEARAMSVEAAQAASATPHDARVPAATEETDGGFDLSLVGRTLIVLGGAYLLRALTEGGFVPAAVGVLAGLAYAVSWSLLSLRPTVSRGSATWYGVATVFTSLPLVFEGARKFQVFGPWSAAFALAAVSAVMSVLIWRRRLEGLAWTFTLAALSISPLLMLETKTIVPFALYLTALGILTLWFGYEFEWTLLRWIVALETDIVLFALCFLVATNRTGVAPALAIAVTWVAFAAYLSSFAVRTLLREREAVPFEMAQTLALLAFGFGGAMWVAASHSTLEVPFAIAMIALAAGSYAASFAFIPRRFATPRNFVFYSSLALMLIVAGGAFITRGFPSSVFFAACSATCAYFAVHFRKSSLALHAAVYLFSGFVGAGLVQLGFASLVLKVDGAWPLPGAGSVLLLLACAVAAGIRPIERQGSFELWTAAKVMILTELGWILATLLAIAAGITLLDGKGGDPAIVAVMRTGVMAGLTVVTAWVSRFPTLSPARLLCNPLMIALGLKLLWEDFRVGRPGTLFVSLAIVGIALILTPRLRRGASLPQPVTPTATAVPAA